MSICNANIVMIHRPPLIGVKIIMAKKTKRAKRRWTKENVREIRLHSREKTPVSKISKLTKRTVGALRQKAFQIGVSLGHRR